MRRVADTTASTRSWWGARPSLRHSRAHRLPSRMREAGRWQRGRCPSGWGQEPPAVCETATQSPRSGPECSVPANADGPARNARLAGMMRRHRIQSPRCFTDPTSVTVAPGFRWCGPISAATGAHRPHRHGTAPQDRRPCTACAAVSHGLDWSMNPTCSAASRVACRSWQTPRSSPASPCGLHRVTPSTPRSTPARSAPPGHSTERLISADFHCRQGMRHAAAGGFVAHGNPQAVRQACSPPRCRTISPCDLQPLRHSPARCLGIIVEPGQHEIGACAGSDGMPNSPSACGQPPPHPRVLSDAAAVHP